MLDLHSCLILGDSLAQGVSYYLPSCLSYTKIGLTTDKALDYYRSFPFEEVVVISLGINDHNSGAALKNLRYIRNRIQAKQVIWFIPSADQSTQDAIAMVAAEWKDKVIVIAEVTGEKQLHPTPSGYKKLADAVRKENE